MNLGNIYAQWGKFADAVGSYQKSLAIDRNTGDKEGEAASLVVMGGAHLQMGKLSEAMEFFTIAHAISRELENPMHEAEALRAIGRVHVLEWRVCASTSSIARCSFTAEKDGHFYQGVQPDYC